MVSHPQPKERLSIWPEQMTPLGAVRFGGVLRHGLGTGFDGFRHFGLYALAYLFDGSGRYRDHQGRELPLERGSLVTVLPDVPQQYGPIREGNWHEVYICFSGPAFDAWRKAPGGLSLRAPTWRLLPVEKWLPRFTALLDMRAGRPAEAMRLAAATHALLADALAVRPDQVRDRTWAARAAALLEQDPAQEVSVDQVAGRLEMSTETFRKRFRRELGISPAAYRRRHRVRLAAELLRQREVSVEMAAFHTGFWDAAHFTHAFRREMGMNPGAWKSTRGRGAQS